MKDISSGGGIDTSGIAISVYLFIWQSQLSGTGRSISQKNVQPVLRFRIISRHLDNL